MSSFIEAPALYTFPDVIKLTGASRATIYRWAAANRFPKPFAISDNSVRFDSRAVNEWIAKKIASAKK